MWNWMVNVQCSYNSTTLLCITDAPHNNNVSCYNMLAKAILFLNLFITTNILLSVIKRVYIKKSTGLDTLRLTKPDPYE